MTDGRVRLPLAGGPAERAPTEVAEDAARVALPAPTIAIAGPGAEAMASQLRDAARALGATAHVWHANLRAAGDVEVVAIAPDETRLRAPAGAIDEALRALVSGEGPGAALRIAVGPPFVARCRATLSILVTGGAPALAWDPGLRALRDRFELVIAEPRPRLARELVQRALAASS